MAATDRLSARAIDVDVDACRIRVGAHVYELVPSETTWFTTDATGAKLWFRPVPRPDGGWWFVGEPLDARVLCALWCGACERAGVDARPAARSGQSGTFRRSS
jgi:hypothetical protein